MTGLRPIALAALVGSLTASSLWAQDGSPDSAQRADSNVRVVGVLRPGDALKVLVFRNLELSGEYVIDARGMVQIPGLGEIQAGNQDPTTVKARLRAALVERGFSAPEVAVQPLVRVSVLGAVAKPSLYAVDPGPSLIQLLTLAGGPLETADLRRTRVIRDGRAFTVDLESGLSGGGAGRVVLYSNDVVVVPRRRGLTRENLAFVFSSATVLLSIVNVVLAARR